METLLSRMIDNEERMARALELQAAPKPSKRTFLKTEATLKFPVGSVVALEDLEGWLWEFDWVGDHIAGPDGMIPEDRIGQLLSAWDKDTLPGEDMRLDQRRMDYKAAEQRGDYEFCWQMLLETLWKYEASLAARRRRAETLWRD